MRAIKIKLAIHQHENIDELLRKLGARIQRVEEK
jgi:N-dimethylarginine dimethylaminohydrolase